LDIDRSLQGFENVNAPQQSNGYDCGIYTLLYAKHLIAVLSQLQETDNITGALAHAVANISPREATEFRQFARDDILQLASCSKSH